MAVIKKSDLLNRLIRADPLPELGVSTLTEAIKAIEQGRTDQAKQLVEYLWREGKGLHDLYADWIWALYGYIAETYGDEALLKAAMASERLRVQQSVDTYRNIGHEEYVLLIAEFMRAHRSGPRQTGDVTVTDLGNRYVIASNPCGSGGRMRLGDPIAGTPSRIGPPYNFGIIKNAHPWTWGKADFPAYCVHCVVNEILSVDIAGFPLSVHEYPDDPRQPCLLMIYKDPRAVPEHYYTRIGKVKPK